jgi:hypothetical protein
VAISILPTSQTSPLFRGAISIDLIVTIPLCWFVLAKIGIVSIKGTKWVFLTSVLAGIVFLREEARLTFLQTLENLLPFVLALLLAMIFCRGVRWAYRITQSPDVLLASTTEVTEKFGNNFIAKVIASELAMLIYLVAPSPPNAVDERFFSSHISSGYRSMLGGLLFAGLLETMVVHIVVHLFSPTFAWVLTISSLVGCMLVVSHMRALPRRRHSISDSALVLKNGLFGTAVIKLNEIDTVDPIDGFNDNETPRLAMLGKLDPVNVKIVFKNPQTYEANHGIERTVSSLLFHVDHPGRFVEALRDQVEHFDSNEPTADLQHRR